MSAGVLTVFTDGGSRGNPGPAAIGVHAELAGKMVYEESSYIGETTNNTAEYEALLRALSWIKATLPSFEQKPSSIEFFLDSQLVVEQVSGRYKVKQPHILTYVRNISSLLQEINIPAKFLHIPRTSNTRADFLVNQALDAKLSLK